VIIDINAQLAKKFASQGQTRTAAVAIKIAEREIMREELGSAPLLLLDDVMSELDAGRREFIMSESSDGQVIITTCDESEYRSDDTTVVQIENGKVYQEK